ncbi:DMT family transporter [Pseudomonas pudica]|uniref:DMT family transporter n=1 Tax=Pseudomonas pudica TaxID=272772 RepID=A0ABS0FUE4_9PSED|nr:DMT family transporter [Pseudomonas pudica]MBF8643995.1 DMT family transporter [Pseudomonas pudica]MBF8758638.1 DMT family transporter [Pseudomonas pudica]
MHVVFLLFAIFAGSMMPLQAVVNARLGRAIGGPIWAAALSALILTAILIVVALLANKPWPRPAQMGGLPWWAWIGGICGAIILSATAAVVPRIGAASMMALIMVGQVVAAIALDRLGWFGLPLQPLNTQRVLAALFLISGAVLMGLSVENRS